MASTAAAAAAAAAAADISSSDAAEDVTEGKPTLFAMLRDTHKRLKEIDRQRESLRSEITSLYDAISRAQATYWTNQSRAFENFVAEGGANNFEQWCSRFARKESAEAREVAEKQARLRSQITQHHGSILRLDEEYWARWQACMDYILDKPGEREEQPPPSPPSPPPPQHRRSAEAPDLSAPRSQSLSLTAAVALSPPPRPGPSRTATATMLVPESPRHGTKTVSETREPPGRQQLSHAFPGVTDAAPGQLYQAYYQHPSSAERGWYMALCLPFRGDAWAEDVNLDFSMSMMDLQDGFPECYIPEVTQAHHEGAGGRATSPTETITGLQSWAPGYEDGGPHVEERRFLFLFFDDRKPAKLRISARPGQKMTFTKSALSNMPIDWVAAGDLRPADAKVSGSVRGRKSADKFIKMMASRARLGVAAAASTRSDTPGLSAAGAPTFSRGGVPRSPPRPPAPGGGQAADGEGVLDVRARAAGAARTGHSMIQDDLGSSSSPAAAADRMDIDEDYTGAPSTRRSQAAGSERDDASKFDEGLGMDYDLELSKFSSQLPPLRGPSAGGPPPRERLPSFGEIFGARPLVASSQPSPTFSNPAGSFYHHQERFASIDSGWQSQGGGSSGGGGMGPEEEPHYVGSHARSFYRGVEEP